jgi:ABC-type proline/glycine betaine transport system permease subunit
MNLTSNITKKLVVAGRLEGRTAIITGGANGIGRAAARMFAEAGARVAILDIQADAGCGGNRKSRRPGHVSADRRIRYGSRPRLGRYHCTDDDYERLMNINVRSSFVVCREVVSHMLENGGGSIVITSSICGEKGFGLESLYCMTKGAVLQLARSIAIEYRDKGIRANAVCPGFVKTAHGLREIDGLDGLGSMGLARTGTRRTCRACRDGPANGAVSFINQNFYGPLEAIRTAMLLGVMNPFRDLLFTTPWSVIVLLVTLAGYALGGQRTALTVALLMLFIAVTGYWEAAMSSVYLTILSVALALAIGLPFGIWASARPKLHQPVQLALDTLQTLPTLVYLLPVVMLFRNGDFSALIAIISYAVAPAVRYGMAGMAHVPSERIEAAMMSGCTPGQTFRFVRLPSALPTLLMMALSMLVIAALVGTRELGQEVYTSLARGETGPGIVAGLCVACIALVADALLKSGAARAARHEGDVHV